MNKKKRVLLLCDILLKVKLAIKIGQEIKPSLFADNGQTVRDSVRQHGIKLICRDQRCLYNQLESNMKKKTQFTIATENTNYQERNLTVNV